MTTFVDFLSALPAAKLDRLYSSPWTCQAVLRSLPPVAKQYVLRVLFLEAPLPESLMADWCLPSEGAKHRAAITRLMQLRVLLPATSDSGPGASLVLVNPPLRQQLLASVVSGSSGQARPAPASSKKVGDTELETYARAQWEAVLLCLTAAGEGGGALAPGAGAVRSRPPSPLVRSIFQRAGLLTGEQLGVSLAQDRTGRFGFLLKDNSEQLWLVVSNYVAVCEEEKGMDSAEVLMFLLELGFYSPGCKYSMGGLPLWQQTVLEDLAILGLVLLEKGNKERCFVPTHMACALSASLAQAPGVGPTKGFALVETNFKVYAHTGSQFQAELLGLFMRVECRLPNLVIGEISRETAMKAFDAGITAEQIVQYLRKHAHPFVASRVPVIPDTVTDQIRLWEHDRNRIALVQSVLYEDFPTQEAFDTVVAHSKDIGALLWHDTKIKKLVVDEAFHQDIKNFIQRLAPPRKK